MYVRVCIRLYMHTYIHTYIHAYMHTYIHTPASDASGAPHTTPTAYVNYYYIRYACYIYYIYSIGYNATRITYRSLHILHTAGHTLLTTIAKTHWQSALHAKVIYRTYVAYNTCITQTTYNVYIACINKEHAKHCIA